MADELDVGVQHGHIVPHLLHGANQRKGCVGGGIDHFALQRKSAGDAHHVLLLNTHIDKFVRVQCGKTIQTGIAAHIGGDGIKVISFFSYFQEADAEKGGMHAKLGHAFDRKRFICHDSISPSSRSACSYRASVNTLLCHKGTFSAKERPLPLVVFAMTAYGRPDGT